MLSLTVRDQTSSSGKDLNEEEHNINKSGKFRE